MYSARTLVLVLTTSIRNLLLSVPLRVAANAGHIAS